MKQFSVFSFLFLFLLASAGVFALLPSLVLQVIFVFLVLFVVFWAIKLRQGLDINTLLLITAFTLAVAQFGLHFYLPSQTPSWLLLAVTFAWVWFLFSFGLKIVLGRMTAAGRIISVTAALAGAEIMLALLFWPTHFLANASVFFLLFYLAWMITYYYMVGLLNWHRIMIHVVFVSVFVSIILLTAQWQL